MTVKHKQAYPKYFYLSSVNWEKVTCKQELHVYLHANKSFVLVKYAKSFYRSETQIFVRQLLLRR